MHSRLPTADGTTDVVSCYGWSRNLVFNIIIMVKPSAFKQFTRITLFRFLVLQ